MTWCVLLVCIRGWVAMDVVSLAVFRLVLVMRSMISASWKLFLAVASTLSLLYMVAPVVMDHGLMVMNWSSPTLVTILILGLQIYYVLERHLPSTKLDSSWILIPWSEVELIPAINGGVRTNIFFSDADNMLQETCGDIGGDVSPVKLENGMDVDTKKVDDWGPGDTGLLHDADVHVSCLINLAGFQTWCGKISIHVLKKPAPCLGWAFKGLIRHRRKKIQEAGCGIRSDGNRLFSKRPSSQRSWKAPYRWGSSPSAPNNRSQHR